MDFRLSQESSLTQPVNVKTSLVRVSIRMAGHVNSPSIVPPRDIIDKLARHGLMLLCLMLALGGGQPKQRSAAVKMIEIANHGASSWLSVYIPCLERSKQ